MLSLLFVQGYQAERLGRCKQKHSQKQLGTTQNLNSEERTLFRNIQNSVKWNNSASHVADGF